MHRSAECILLLNTVYVDTARYRFVRHVNVSCNACFQVSN